MSSRSGPGDGRPDPGGEQVARYLVDIAGRAPSPAILERRTVNGQRGLVAQHDGVTVTVCASEVADGRIRHIWAVRNPDKLQPWRIASLEEPSTKLDRLLPGPWHITTMEDSSWLDNIRLTKPAFDS